jgi:hypothetical protein
MDSSSIRRIIRGVPYHTEIRVVRGTITRFAFFKNENGFTFEVELPGDISIESGKSYLTISDANTAADERVGGLPQHLFSRHSRMLHLYLRHRRDTQAYGNKWVGDFKVESITTYDVVAECCRVALEHGDRIRIHRRKFEQSPATICCECSVKSVEPIPGTNGFKVEFHDWATLSMEVPKSLRKGYYFAVPADYEPTDK